MRLSIVLCATVILCAALQSNTLAQEQGKPEAKAAANMQEMMKRWMEAATPGESHKHLDALVGKWDVLVRAWMDPSKPPQESKGTCENRWILDGRFVYGEMSGQLAGMPFKSIDITGYDNYKKRYVLSHMDNMSTALYTGDGKLDQSKQVMTWFLKMDDVALDERDKLVKYVIRFVGKDKYVFEGYDEVGGPNEYKAIEIVYTRSKP